MSSLVYGLFSLLGLGFLLCILVVPLVALVRTGQLRRDVDRLYREMVMLRASFDAATTGSQPAEHTEASSEPEPEPEPEEPPTPEDPPAPPPPPAPCAPKEALEQRLTMRWLVWLGGVTIALGGVFLVKYSIEQELLGPTGRCVLGLLLGVALVVAGEWLRRQPLQRAIASVRPSQVPPALTAAGIATMFAVIYAAFALYGLIPPLVTFVALAVIALGAFALALLQGPFVALLGLVGAFLVPMLVPSDDPSAYALFGYLLVVLAAALAIVRYMAWGWLAWIALAGAMLWTALWLVVGWQSGDALALGGFLIATICLFVFLRPRLAPGPPQPTVWRRFLAMSPPDRLAWLTAIAAAVLMYAVVRQDGYGVVSLAALGLLAASFMVIGRRESVFDGFAIVGGLAVAAALATWHLPYVVEDERFIYDILGARKPFPGAPVVPPELVSYVVTAAGFAALFAAGGFTALWRATRPALWAAVSAGAPVLILAIAYWRVSAAGGDLAWTTASLALAGLALAGADRCARHRAAAGMEAALGAYAVGVVAATSLSATIALEQGWLTVALSLQLPALAWIDGKLSVRALRRVAFVVAAIVLARLALNHQVLDYPSGAVPGLNWVLYGYGIPMAAFLAAAWQFRKRIDDNLVIALEGGALVFGVLLVTLEIRHFITGSLDAEDYSLVEQSLQSIAWLAIGYGLYRQRRRSDRAVLRWGWRIVTSLATSHVLLIQVFLSNPMITGDRVGDWPVLNMLLLAYGAPGVFGILFLREARRQGHNWIAAGAGVATVALFFVELSLEVRRAFLGENLGLLRGASDAEWYSYSVAWLVYAGVLLAAGILRGHVALRYASLAILALTVLKVFFSDMDALTGLYRALSFLGLGAALVAIGYLYQRFVFPQQPRPKTGDDATT